MAEAKRKLDRQAMIIEALEADCRRYIDLLEKNGLDPNEGADEKK